MNDENKPIAFERLDHERIPMNMPDAAQPIELSENIRHRLDQWLKRYPADKRQSGVFEALRLVQEENNGSLNVALMDAVAAYLGITKISVYEVAAFYTMYELNPVGRHVIHVCTNISCTLNGAEKVLERLKETLHINLNETTGDRRFTLKEVECLGACIAPPVCMIDKKYYENVTPEKIDRIVADLSTEPHHE
ncbi:MAG: NAD(P)H-dependent oxidoreductase subunit E [Gammaproteobacteria bacterium]|nr:NAD(P)H-dependent oxidoreductase subunit E [Gammaproteobacteria bacterium]